jgi:hypothetical protein
MSVTHPGARHTRVREFICFSHAAIAIGTLLSAASLTEHNNFPASVSNEA